MEVLHHDADEHVEDEETDDEEEGDEVEQHPGVVVPYRLRGEEKGRVKKIKLFNSCFVSLSKETKKHRRQTCFCSLCC